MRQCISTKKIENEEISTLLKSYRRYKVRNDIPSRNSNSYQPLRATSLYLDEEYLVTALVPSEMACLESSPGRISRTEV